MSVFIKGMDKPENCFGCDFNMCDCYCKINHGGIDRDSWFCETVCPISEVPAPHGRLIDSDILKETLDYYILEANWGDKVNKVLRWVKDEFIDAEKTVIEAEVTE